MSAVGVTLGESSAETTSVLHLGVECAKQVGAVEQHQQQPDNRHDLHEEEHAVHHPALFAWFTSGALGLALRIIHPLRFKLFRRVALHRLDVDHPARAAEVLQPGAVAGAAFCHQQSSQLLGGQLVGCFLFGHGFAGIISW